MLIFFYLWLVNNNTNFKMKKYLYHLYNTEYFLLNILIVLTIIVLFLKFFVLYPIYPSSDELVQVERFTKWHNFLRREGISNHTINAFVAVIIKSIFGYNFYYYRFISFFCFCLIVFFFKKLYPNILAFCLLIFLILSSQMLTSYIYIFRGYYIWAFLSVLNFYFIKKYILNNFDNKNYNIILIINLITACHALFTFYIVVPTLFVISVTAIKNKDLNKIRNFFFYFLLPFLFFYFVVCVLEGFVNIFNDNLTLNYLSNNFLHIVRFGFPEGFNKIFFNAHMMNFQVKENIFILLFKNLTSSNEYYDYQYTILGVYIVSSCILLFRILCKKLNIIDYILISIIIFFYAVNFVPELRVHVGIVFFFLFYIFNYVYNLILTFDKKIKFKYFYFFLVFLLLIKVDPPDEKLSVHTKYEIIKVRNFKKNFSCKELNDLLNDHEIWIVKNLYPKDCSSKYDFVNRKNILY